MNTNRPVLRVAVIGFALITSFAAAFAQKKGAYPEDQLNQNEYSSEIRFLASDELMGRMTGSLWNDVAARYIAEQFRAAGLATFKGMDDYFQVVPLKRTFPPSEAKAVFLGDTLRQGKEMLARSGGALDWHGEYVYVGYGLGDPATHTDPYNGLDVKGKVVIAKFGAEKTANQFAGFTDLAEQKRASAASHGAVALIELYRGSFPWRSLTMFLTRSGYELTAGENFPHFLVEDTATACLKKVEATPRGPLAIQTNGLRKEPIHARNVIGFIRGTDPKLSNEYVLLTAHYDHIGTGKAAGMSADTIFNGARDNAMGTVAVIAAAKSFAAKPPKRSVIFAAVTGEEIGEYGSRYLSSNLPVPANQVVFDLNTDGAGYDDTTIVTVIGLERTTAESAIRQGSERYGLKAIGDPVPEQHLFDRSDNANFARIGIPAPNYSAGLRAFGPEIMKYYHKAADQADGSFNFSYFTTFCKAYVHSARLIADMKEKPFWKSGDEYEKAGRALYSPETKPQ